MGLSCTKRQCHQVAPSRGPGGPPGKKYVRLLLVEDNDLSLRMHERFLGITADRDSGVSRRSSLSRGTSRSDKDGYVGLYRQVLCQNPAVWIGWDVERLLEILTSLLEQPEPDEVVVLVLDNDLSEKLSVEETWRVLSRPSYRKHWEPLFLEQQETHEDLLLEPPDSLTEPQWLSKNQGKALAAIVRGLFRRRGLVLFCSSDLPPSSSGPPGFGEDGRLQKPFHPKYLLDWLRVHQNRSKAAYMAYHAFFHSL